MDDAGLDPDRLEHAIARAKGQGMRPKLLYTMANFHNPTATTLTLERRKAVIEICRRHHTLIAQDDAYGALGFGAMPLPSLYALSDGGGVVLLGTFSKTLATGLRIGWIMGDKAVIDAVTRMTFRNGHVAFGHRTSSPTSAHRVASRSAWRR